MGNGNGYSGAGTVTAIGDTGHKVYSNVRRFIVVDPRELFCICVYVIFFQIRSHYEKDCTDFSKGQLQHMEAKAARSQGSMPKIMP